MKEKVAPRPCISQPHTGAISGAIGIYANAPHPHAAALFVDFMKSAEGAKILAATGRIRDAEGEAGV